MKTKMETDVKMKVLQTLLGSFNAMPAWLKNCLIITLCLGFFYFGYVRKEIIYSHEKATTEQLQSRMDELHKKIVKIEDIREANENMVYNIDEVRGIVQGLSELHTQHTNVIIKAFRLVLTPSQYRELLDEIDEAERDYKREVNDLFEKKSRDHLKSSVVELEE